MAVMIWAGTKGLATITLLGTPWAAQSCAAGPAHVDDRHRRHEFTGVPGHLPIPLGRSPDQCRSPLRETVPRRHPAQARAWVPSRASTSSKPSSLRLLLQHRLDQGASSSTRRSRNGGFQGCTPMPARRERAGPWVSRASGAGSPGRSRRWGVLAQTRRAVTGPGCASPPGLGCLVRLGGLDLVSPVGAWFDCRQCLRS